MFTSGYLLTDVLEPEDLLSEEEDPEDGAGVVEGPLSDLLACPEVVFRA